ncbi:MAG: adenine phosphoribosyltransferase [Conexivisphaera sp.]
MSDPSTFLRNYIRDIPDYPVKGVIFRDLTPLFRDAVAFRTAVNGLADRLRDLGADVVAGIEARGFIVGAPIALALGTGFVPLRKPGKLPWRKRSKSYQLEYGSESIEIHEDAISRGQRVIVVDDLLATGGTASAAAKLVEEVGGVVAGIGFLVELRYLNGREKLRGYRVESLVAIDRERWAQRAAQA